MWHHTDACEKILKKSINVSSLCVDAYDRRIEEKYVTKPFLITIDYDFKIWF